MNHERNCVGLFDFLNKEVCSKAKQSPIRSWLDLIKTSKISQACHYRSKYDQKTAPQNSFYVEEYFESDYKEQTFYALYSLYIPHLAEI